MTPSHGFRTNRVAPAKSRSLPGLLPLLLTVAGRGFILVYTHVGPSVGGGYRPLRHIHLQFVTGSNRLRN